MTTRGRLGTGGGADDRLARGAQVRTLIAAEPLPPGVEPAAVSGWLLRLCAASVRSVPTTGAVVTVETGDGLRAVAAASDPVYGALDEMQSTVGEGPSVQAFATRRPVLGADLSDRTVLGWPAFSAVAHDVGVEAAFAFPLQIGAARLGTFTLYRDTVGSLTPAALGLAITFAELALEAILDGQALAPQGESTLGHALDGGLVIYQAQGMVMIDLGIPLADALARLKAHAYATERPLSEVARDLVDGTLRLPRDDR